MIVPSGITREWKDFLVALNVDNMFEYPQLRVRAFGLFRRDRCECEYADEHQIIGRVKGETGTYSVVLRAHPYGFSHRCTCPSDYEPCKHTGAFLYALRDALGAGAGRTEVARPRPTGTVVRPAPGTIIGVSDVSTAEGPSANRFRAEASPVTRFLRPDPNGTDGTESSSSGDAGGGAHGAGRTGPSYRPVFRLEPERDYSAGGTGRYLLKPALVYLRRDGADGRIDPFISSKPRIRGNDTTEGLISLIRTSDDGAISALRVLSRWRDRSAEGFRDEMELPIELYLPRPDRLTRELPARPRLIVRVRVRWDISLSHDRRVSLKPVVSIVDRDGYDEILETPEEFPELDERGVIRPVARTGSLWYLFDTDLPGDPYHVLGAVSDLLRLRNSLSLDEATELREMCGGRLGDLVEIDAPPPAYRIVTSVPRPVIEINITGHSEYGTAWLFFRYGALEIDGSDTVQLLPAELVDLERLGVAIGGVPPGTAWYLARNFEAENAFRDDVFAVTADLSPECPIRDILALRGKALLDLGFEIRVNGTLVTNRKATRGYRVVASGESWFSVEPGLIDGDDFFGIDEVICGRIAVAAGRVFLLDERFELPRAFKRSDRIGKRDLSTIDEIAELLGGLDDPALREYRELKQRLRGFESIEKIDVPTAFTGSLRPYQRDGLDWLWFLHRYGLGGILADDMGLGKTVQALALLLAARESGEMTRALVVCPVSTLHNWHAECKRFAPSLIPIVHGGPDRTKLEAVLRAVDVVLVSYDTFLRDVKLLRDVSFEYLILDEAQIIKNPNAKRRRAIAAIDAPHRLALTGTPVENGAVELWSIMDVLMPGLLGTQREFSRRYDADNVRIDREALDRLQRIIHPLILRRTKAQVAPELPRREEQVIYADLGSRQAGFYEMLRKKFEVEIAECIANGGSGDSSIVILEAMLRLRQAAILPALVDPKQHTIPGAKLDVMVDLLAEIASEGNKALVFSQFTAVLDEVEKRLDSVEVARYRLDGSTPQKLRAERIAAFQRHPGSAFFLISLKAGGVGINLTAADYVLLLDPWWNPAVEAQAIDRSHRIGRTATVFAYRLVARGTIEEKILRLQEKKRELADALIKADHGLLRSLSSEDLLELFKR
ncbi:MAG: DEAD/DEAH box helicase [Spirochaetaceae bacterium]|nr:MAG: DEAD/DEAH box helicase [Spirochaetaceae bacterium]